MYYQIDIIDIILLLGAGQGIFLGILILHKHHQLLANRFLGILMIVYSLILFYLTFSESTLHRKYPLIMGLLMGLTFLIAPLHYLYSKYLIANVNKFNLKDLFHFTYYILYQLLLAYFVISGNSGIDSTSNSELPLQFVIFNWILVIQCLGYMVITLIILDRYSIKIKDVFSNIEKLKLAWLRNITLIITIVLLFFLIENILYLFEIRTTNIFDFSSVIAAIMFYTLGYMGLLKTDIFSEPSVTESIHQIMDLNSFHEKYSKSGLSENSAEKIQEKLLYAMENEAPYIDSNLTLNKLARILQVTPHNLSQVVNIHLKQNFFDFINKYRIEKVKKDIIDPEKSNLTLLAIAFEAGINSKSAFNIIFKKHTGMTPTEYKRSLLPRD